MIKKKKQTILMVALILSLVLIISGVTYAFFSYTRQGTTDNTIETGSITFLYTENSGTGRGVSIVDAYPISDEVGKNQTGSDKMFDFKITSNTMNKTALEYEITARKSKDSTLAEDVVKVYLTKVNGTTEEEIVLSKYSSLTQTSKVDVSNYTEKTLYTKRIPSNTTSYEESYRLRMWIAEGTDFSGVEQEDGTITYPYNDKTFKLTVNVYANGKVITEEEVAYEANANISTLSVEGEQLTAVEDEDYDYEMNLPEGTTETTINIETENPNAQVEVEKIDSLAYSSNVKRLSASKTVSLTEGNNYFKVKITSENKQKNKEYIIKIKVGKEKINTLNSLSLTNCTLSPIFNSETTEYTCTVGKDITSTEVIYEKTSDLSTVTVSGDKNLVSGENTVTITVEAENGEEKIYTVVVSKKAWALTDDVNGNGQADVGDQLTVDKESFYVISNDGDNIKMLAKYNVFINNTDLQSETLIGRNKNINTCDEIDSNAGLAVYDIDDYDNVYDYSISDVKTHVDKYVNKLNQLSANIIEGTLIDSEDLIKLGCSLVTDSKYYTDLYQCNNSDYSWIYDRGYFTKIKGYDLDNNTGITYFVSNNSQTSWTDDGGCDEENAIRPVIIISASDI